MVSCYSVLFQHDAGRIAFEDAQLQMVSITEKIKEKKAYADDVQTKIQKNKADASDARKLEQVTIYNKFHILSLMYQFILPFGKTIIRPSFQECILKQESLIPLEQAARQKLTEIKSVLESEKSQGSVLKAILHAKQSKEVEGIYGRLGDLGAIDGVFFLSFVNTKVFKSVKRTVALS